MVVETGVDEGAVEVGAVVGVTVVVLGGAGEDAPEPIAVVIGPDSMYTPETYQSSGAGVLTMRRTPTWKSSELVEVEAAMLFATLVSGEEPFEAQRPTVPAENWGRSQLCRSEDGTVGTRRNVRRCRTRSCTTCWASASYSSACSTRRPSAGAGPSCLPRPR